MTARIASFEFGSTKTGITDFDPGIDSECSGMPAVWTFAM